MPNNSQLFTVVFTSRKNSKFGRTHFLVPIEVKNGPSYVIDFIAFLTIPEPLTTSTLKRSLSTPARLSNFALKI
jgi:hypothetical protein